MDRYVGPGSVGLQWGERLKVCGFERGGRHPRVGSGLVNLPGLPERRLERLDGDFDTIGAGHRSRSSDNTQQVWVVGLCRPITLPGERNITGGMHASPGWLSGTWRKSLS